MSKLSERLLALRKEQGLTQLQVAELCKISYMSYRRYELGEREPSASVLWNIADLFAVSIDFLVGRSDIR